MAHVAMNWLTCVKRLFVAAAFALPGLCAENGTDSGQASGQKKVVLMFPATTAIDARDGAVEMLVDALAMSAATGPAAPSGLVKKKGALEEVAKAVLRMVDSLFPPKDKSLPFALTASGHLEKGSWSAAAMTAPTNGASRSVSITDTVNILGSSALMALTVKVTHAPADPTSVTFGQSGAGDENVVRGCVPRNVELDIQAKITVDGASITAGGSSVDQAVGTFIEIPVKFRSAGSVP